MSWSSVIRFGDPVVETHYWDVLTLSDLSAATWKTLALARAHNVIWLLADCTQLRAGYAMADLYRLTDGLLQSPFSPLMRVAVLPPPLPAADEEARFWETTCYTRGTMVRIFRDRLCALHWLISGVPVCHVSSGQGTHPDLPGFLPAAAAETTPGLGAYLAP